MSLAALAAATFMGLARTTGPGALQTLYAEDGTIFLSEGLALSPARAFRTTYVGYIHVIPRSIAEVAAALPTRDAAIVFSGAAAFVVAALALLVFRASAGHIRSPWIRGLLAACLVLLPVAQVEVLNATANLQWYLLPTVFWLLVWKPTNRIEISLAAAVVLLTCLSDPLVLALLPLAALRLVILRQWHDRLVSLSLFSGLALQVMGMLVGHAHRTLHATPDLLKVAGWYLIAVVGRGLFGTRLVGAVHQPKALVLTAVAIVITLLVAYVAAMRGTAAARRFAATAAVMSVLSFFLPVMLSGVNAPRYSVPPLLILLSGFAVVIDTTVVDVKGGVLRASRLAATGLLALVWIAGFRVDTPRSHSKPWQTELARAEAMCRQNAPASVTVPIAPPGWTTVLQCRELGLGPPTRTTDGAQS